MYARLIIEQGDYLDNNGNDVNLIIAEVKASTPTGDNKGFTYYATLDDAKVGLKIYKKFDKEDDNIKLKEVLANIKKQK